MEFNLHFPKPKEEVVKDVKEEITERVTQGVTQGAVESVNEVVETHKVDVLVAAALAVAGYSVLKCIKLQHKVDALEDKYEYLDKRLLRCENRCFR